MNALLDRATVSGVDDAIAIDDLVELDAAFPFVEFGILLSGHRAGSPRYPSKRWLDGLAEIAPYCPLRLSAHLCGRWAAMACEGDWSFTNSLPWGDLNVQRVQINFPRSPGDLDAGRFFDGLRRHAPTRQCIFQVDKIDDWLVTAARKADIDAVPLYDVSRGGGSSPDRWPEPLDGIYCGYAGGIDPDNARDEARKIEHVASGPFWIDAESGLREAQRDQLDLDRVRAYLEAAAEHLRSASPSAP